MSLISLGEFQEWKQNEVTKAFMQAGQERIYDALQLLSVQAGMDSVQDNYLRGVIAAYREISEFRIDDLVDMGAE